MAVGQIQVIEEVAADRAARNRGGRRVVEPARVAAVRQERLLDLGGDAHLLLEPRLLDRLAVEPRVLDRHGRLGRQRLERRTRRGRQKLPFLPAVEVQHPDPLLLARRLVAVEVAHEPERHALHVADAERDRAVVHVGEVAVEQVRHHAGLPRAKDLGGDLLAGREAAARQGGAPAAAPHLELQLVLRGAEHDEAPLGARHLDGRVQHQRQHVVEHAARPQGAQALEQRRHLPQVADGRRRGAVGRLGVLGQQEHQLRAAAPAQPHAVAVNDGVLGDLLIVDERAVPGVAVAQHVLAGGMHDLRVVAGDLAAQQPEVIALATADGERVLVDRHQPAARAVGDLEAGVRHRERPGYGCSVADG